MKRLITSLILIPNILWAAVQFLFVAAWLFEFPASAGAWPWYVLLSPTLLLAALGVGFLLLVSVLQATLWKNDDIEVVETVELITLEDGRLAIRSFVPPAGSQMLN